MKAELPLVTIITVCFNAEQSLEETIQSVIKQSYPNIEYLIIDGGSCDNTVNIIKKYSNHISFWVSERDGGVYYGMNKGIEKSNGEWLCFMNAGDRFADNEVLKNIFSSDIELNKVGVILGDVIFEYLPYGRVLKRFNDISGEDQSLCLCHQSTLTKGSLLRKLKYDTSYKIFADINAFHILWQKGVKFQYLPITMAVFEGFDGISSTKPWLSFKENTRLRNFHFYDSVTWWKWLFILIIKRFVNLFMSENRRKRSLFKRLAKKYSLVN